MKPLVIHVRACNCFGGPERQIVAHIKESLKYRHLVITFDDDEIPNAFYQYCIENGINAYSIPSEQLFLPKVIMALRCIFSKHQWPIVCCHGYKALILSIVAKTGLTLSLVAFARGHTGENLKVRIYEYLELKAQWFADAVVAVSQGYAEYLETKGCDISQVEVIHNSIDVTRFAPFIEKRALVRRKYGFLPEHYLIGTAGRFSPEKSQKDLITSFASLEQQFPHVRLLLCGDGPQRCLLENLVETLALKNVIFLGFRKDLDEIMPIFDLFVLPSLTEGLPNVLLEAAACKVPLVATDVGGVPEIIKDKKTGLLVEPGNIDQLELAISRCLEDRSFSRELAEKAYDMVCKEFDVGRQTTALEDLYGRLLTKDRENVR